MRSIFRSNCKPHHPHARRTSKMGPCTPNGCHIHHSKHRRCPRYTNRSQPLYVLKFRFTSSQLQQLLKLVSGPGSCLFLFEGPQTINAGDSAFKSPFVGSSRTFRYLHCGDFRASPAHVLHPAVKGKRMDHVYLDTTYLDPKVIFVLARFPLVLVDAYRWPIVHVSTTAIGYLCLCRTCEED
jgi:hypothetical protein